MGFFDVIDNAYKAVGNAYDSAMDAKQPEKETDKTGRSIASISGKAGPRGISLEKIADSKNSIDIMLGDYEVADKGAKSRLYDELADATANKKKSREKNIADMTRHQENLLKYTNAQVDLRPVAQLVDTWTGSNFANTYASPKAAQQTIGQVQVLQNAINKQELGMAEDDRIRVANELKSRISSDNNYLNQQVRALGIGAGLLKSEGKAKKAPKLDAGLIQDFSKTKAFIETANDLRKRILENKNKLGFGTNLADVGILQYAGNAKLRGYLTERKAMRSQLLKLVTQYGVSYEKRLTDKDFERYEQIIGSMEDSPESVIQRLEEISKASVDSWNTQYDLYKTGGHFMGNLQPIITEKRKARTTPKPTPKPGKKSLFSADEIAKLRGK